MKGKWVIKWTQLQKSQEWIFIQQKQTKIICLIFHQNSTDEGKTVPTVFYAKKKAQPKLTEKGHEPLALHTWIYPPPPPTHTHMVRALTRASRPIYHRSLLNSCFDQGASEWPFSNQLWKFAPEGSRTRELVGATRASQPLGNTIDLFAFYSC